MLVGGVEVNIFRLPKKEKRRIKRENKEKRNQNMQKMIRKDLCHLQMHQVLLQFSVFNVKHSKLFTRFD